MNSNNDDSRIFTPKINSRNPQGKMKLRDKRMIRLNIERRKASGKVLTKDISPGIVSMGRNNAATPSKVRIFANFCITIIKIFISWLNVYILSSLTKEMEEKGFLPKEIKINGTNLLSLLQNKIQSRIKMSRQRGRMKNITTVEPMGQEIRSQSPNLYNPMIQIKYETNNYYPQMAKSPQPANEHSTINQLINNPKMENSNLKNNETMFQDRNHGIRSPQPVERNEYDFYPDKMERVGSPRPTVNNVNFVNKIPLFQRNKKKSNTFQLKKDQE